MWRGEEPVVAADGRDGNARAAEAPRLLARTFYRELRKSGYSAKELLAVSTEMIDLVTRDIRDRSAR
ncbi:MAG TPA: hypothetical protein VE620_12425 [Myxococcales bacterium]|nr:hypothetical protein [Myxococcales bacterium]